jgi:uncharacterized protein (DUF427 family)
MLTPGPERSIAHEPATRRWRALFAGHVIADSNRALLVREGGGAPVVYFPREDVGMAYMGRTDHVTRSPGLGEATYYTLRMHTQLAENAAWTYETPHDAGELAHHIAFDPAQVEVYEVEDAAVNPDHEADAEARSFDRSEVDEVVKHTDSGAGASQREPWEPNVQTPSTPDGGLR